MSGNVWEWAEDQWHDDYDSAPNNGTAWVDQEEGADRIFRGGSWNYNLQLCRATYRNYIHPTYRSSHVGFRLVLSF